MPTVVTLRSVGLAATSGAEASTGFGENGENGENGWLPPSRPPVPLCGPSGAHAINRSATPRIVEDGDHRPTPIDYSCAMPGCRLVVIAALLGAACSGSGSSTHDGGTSGGGAGGAAGTTGGAGTTGVAGAVGGAGTGGVGGEAGGGAGAGGGDGGVINCATTDVCPSGQICFTERVAMYDRTTCTDNPCAPMPVACDCARAKLSLCMSGCIVSADAGALFCGAN